MKASKWVVGSVAVSGALAVVVLFFAVIWPRWREVSERAISEQLETHNRRILDAQKTRVVTQCRSVAYAIEAYKCSPVNSLNETPESLQELLTPQFGGTGFLKNGAADLVDLWGNRVQLAFMVVGGEKTPLIFTHAPDGTPVSQYGIGSESRVPAK